MKRTARLTLPNEMAVLEPLQAFVAEAARARGFGGKAVGEIQVALEEAVSNVIQHAYEKGEEATFDVTVENVPLGLAVTVADQGIPYAPESVPEYKAPRDVDEAKGRGLGLFLMRSLVDEVIFRNLGPKGKETRLVKYLPDRSVASETEEGSTQQTEVSMEVYEGPLTWTFRPMRPEEAIEVSRCAYEAYGYTYPNSHLYYPERVVELNRTGHILSIVAANDDDILGHCALEITPGADTVELGMAFVKPRYRGRGILKEMTEHLIAEAGKLRYGGAFVQSVTTHPASQKAALSMGFRYTAILVDFFASSMNFRKLAGCSSDRLTLAYQYLPLAGHPKRSVYPPGHHKNMLASIYESLGLERSFEATSSPLSSRSPGPGLTSAKPVPSINAATIDVEEAAAGTEPYLHHLTRQFCLRRTDAILVRLNLEDPSTPELARALEDRDFLFCGVLPARMGDRLAMIYLNNCTVDFDGIVVAGETAKDLTGYIRSLAETREEDAP
ncbi:MAG: GNAT family N-acetyltransferase [Thermovirgaceae bacterium]